jgi:hypothetical protein
MAGIEGNANLQRSATANNINKVKSIVSTLCKDASQLAGFTEIHHSFPVFLGNTRKGNRGDVEVDDYIHTKLHRLTGLMLLINDLPYPNKGREVFRKMFMQDRSDWKKALKVVKQTAKYIDDVCGPIVTGKPSYEPIEPKISEAMKIFGVYK